MLYIIIYFNQMKLSKTINAYSLQEEIDKYTNTNPEYTCSLNDEKTVAIIFQSNKTHTIYYTGVPIQIPINMTVSEFKKYMTIQDSSPDLLFENTSIRLFADEKFTNNEHYSSTPL